MTRKVVPMLHVPDVRSTVDWYREELGFDVTVTYSDGGEGQSFAMVAFGSGEVMFSSGGKAVKNHRRDADLYVYTDGVDAFYERIKDRVDIIEGPHNMFYGMREVLVRDPNGFWITFGQELSQDELTPWPPEPIESLHPYIGTYRSDDGMRVQVVGHEGRLLAFPEESPGVYLRPAGAHAFTPVMTEDASVTFDVSDAVASGLTFTQDGMTKQLRRDAS